MYVFSSLAAAREAGFTWHSFSESEQLHIVELDRPARNGGRRMKALAFARPDPPENAESPEACELAAVP